MALPDRDLSEVCEDTSFERLQKLHGSFVFIKFIQKIHHRPVNAETQSIKWVFGGFTSIEEDDNILSINITESISRIHTIPIKDLLYIYSVDEMETNLRISPKDLENGKDNNS